MKPDLNHSLIFVGSLAHNRLLYLTASLICAAIFAANRLIASRDTGLALSLLYVFLLIAYAYAIYLGVLLTHTETSTTFCLLPFALPLTTCDQPYRVGGLLITVSAVFCIATTLVKPASVATVDTVNTLSFLFLGVIANYYMMNMKFREMPPSSACGTRTRH